MIRDRQHGYRRKMNLPDFFSMVINVCDKHEAVDVIYLDFHKAFDKVPQRILLHQVSELDIRG